MSEEAKIACYYFPNYHPDPRNEHQHGKGWTEWELVRRAVPRFEGHRQPKRPVWGFENEADPAVMARKIDAAANSGIDTFLFDWYYYDDGPFLERALEQGFLHAPNNDKMSFACMWANHDWVDIHPAKRNVQPPLQYPGKVSPETFDAMTDHIIETYFLHPSHWLVDGCPFFSVYELSKLMAGFGSVEATRKALNRFRDKTKAAGFPNLHLNAVVWGHQVLPTEETVDDLPGLIDALGFNSINSYVWIHHVPLSCYPCMSYQEVADQYFDYVRKAIEDYSVPYYPNVTLGWDSTPRLCTSDIFSGEGYPSTAILDGNTPEAFHSALLRLRDLLDQRPEEERIFTINCWNEWTEGSYLEPEEEHGFAYLEALDKVFGRSTTHAV